ncbi:T-cell immunoglobulin and mucin domain-containing protein 4-like [Trichomycterus rosablanca]|uniref:T-cell immunoglobulin and mucin domain-containing protein 4-like n=1 Tax=Trichomycterus rosablanca TaxID=2290929 RepID=UPI002F3537C5
MPEVSLLRVKHFIMNLLCLWLSPVWLPLCLTVRTCRCTTVRGFEGENVTLPCKYDWHYHGKCEICWIKGEIPSMGCGTEIIATDGDKVVHQTSSRYQLNGELQKGDVSMMIINARQNDSGKYGCRVHVPGWFNDDKYTVHLNIMRGKLKRRNLMMAGIMQNLNDSVIYSNSQINPGRQRTALAVENVYNLEPENVYEQ